MAQEHSSIPDPGLEEPTPLAELQRRFAPVVKFVQTEIFGSIALVAVTIVALVWANSSWGSSYEELIHGKLAVSFRGQSMNHSLQHWINDGLMTLFFFLIGLEIKRELTTGRLRDRRAAVLPAMAALGGIVIPVGIYAAFNGGGPADHGWAIPMATDIAFAIGMLGLLGKRLPPELRLFLLTLAIIDDIAGILMIAIFYSKGLSFAWLIGVAAIPFVLWFMRWFGIQRFVWYIIISIAAWLVTLMSGVHPTIAGVVVGLMTPSGLVAGRNVLEMVEHVLHPWVAYLVVPVFAFVNAGVKLDVENLSDAFNRNVTWGVGVGLVVGKTIGVSLFTWLGLRLGLGKLPPGIGMRHILAMSPLAGIGFTVALVIAALSFEEADRLAAAKVGILVGSLVAALLGLVALYWVSRRDAR